RALHCDRHRPPAPPHFPYTTLFRSQGTTSTRAIVFDVAGRPVASAQKELPQIFPKPGWVEHDPEEIWRATVEVCRGALAKARLRSEEHTSELQSRENLVCRLLLEKK